MSSNLERRAENLAYCFQEVLTVGERLRSNRQHVTDAESFRHQVREAIKTSAEEARRRGYTGEDIQLATFAVVAFLDESILNMRNPVFADWPRRPLQEEYFGHHVAGEIFFQNLDKILQRNESQDMGDLLEVYQLCMLLGFAGKYSMAGRGELQARIQTTGEKIARIRQSSGELSPAWMPPNDAVATAGADPWVKRLIYMTAGVLLITLLLFGVYKMNLGSGVGRMETLAAQGRS
ncbi:MAG TPA: DotU family type IV/VI secretion system protein [Bryobacteraceae bacterium]|nr:DotU family type IV/VI secretion system protein [Bryobacteraceae bacterium]